MKGQISVELFLVLSVIVAFIVILYGTATQQIGKTRALNDAVLSKGAVDSLAQMIDFVYLSGEGSVLTKELFVSPNSNCFYLDANKNKVYCTISSEYLQELTKGKQQVYSQALSIPNGKLGIHCSPFTGGWILAVVNNTVGTISVSCSKTG